MKLDSTSVYQVCIQYYSYTTRPYLCSAIFFESQEFLIWNISKRVGVILRVRGLAASSAERAKGSRIRVKYSIISVDFKFSEGYRPCI